MLPEELARAALEHVLPRRWSHVVGVASRAVEVAPSLPPADRGALIAAAWLHDIGYAPDLVATGFHPLDGARYLRSVGVDARVTCLVAHHSCAVVEARLRGVDLGEFPIEASMVAEALLYCDMTTGPDGQRLEVVERLDEIRHRYGPDSLVTRFIEQAAPELIATVRRVEARLG